MGCRRVVPRTAADCVSFASGYSSRCSQSSSLQPVSQSFDESVPGEPGQQAVRLPPLSCLFRCGMVALPEPSTESLACRYRSTP